MKFLGLKYFKYSNSNLKTISDGINIRLLMMEESVSQFENSNLNCSTQKNKRKINFKNPTGYLGIVWDNTKWLNIHIIGDLEGEKREI